MKPYLVEVAVDERGFLPQLARFRQVMLDAEIAIKRAMVNYRESDERTAATLSAVAPVDQGDD